MKNVFKLFLGTILCLAVLSCDIGLGEIVDIDAPELTLNKMVSGTAGCEETDSNTKRYFDTTIFTKQEVSFYGQATDNVGVSRVYVEIKWLDDSDYTLLKECSVNGNSWSVDVVFQKEGACWLKFVASDKAGNFGSKSSKIVSLFVDHNAPVGDAWYIDRLINGIQYGFKSFESLYKLVEEDDPNLTNPTNKDVAQNRVFNVCGTLSDSIGVGDGMTLTLEPYDQADPRISGIGISSETSSNYAPKFKISPEMEIDGKTYKLPESGKHYYQIKYSAKDLVTDPAPNAVTDAEIVAGWFLWWPESDNPKCYISTAENDSEIKVYTSDSLNITVFDDDALSGDVKVELKKDQNILKSKNVNISGTTTRETNIILQVPDIPQILTLSVSAKDINGNELNKDYSVYVTDDFTPTLILTSPENNQIPSVTGISGDISFSGITLDKAGCKYLEFVWVPDSVKSNVTEKNALAVAWLKEIASGNAHDSYVPDGANAVKVTEGTGPYAGCRLWSAKLTEAGLENSFIKHTFKFTISALNDFADDKAKEKNLVARVTREDGNFMDTEIKLAADNLAPEIQLVNPVGNMEIIDQDVDFNIKYKVSKSSGIKISETKLFYVDPSGTENLMGLSYDSTNGIYVSAKIPKEKLAEFVSGNINPKYRIYAEDVLGNTNSATYQFVISSLPQLKSITSSASTKCKKDDVISINASFSKVVTIPSGDTPILRLKGISNSKTGLTEEQEIDATFKEGSGTTTLIFEYKVNAGDVSSGLQVFNESGVGPIKGLNTNSTYVHLTTLQDADNLQSKRASNPITIDGVVPMVTGVQVTSDGTADNKNGEVTYLKAGRIITATITTDKKVTVQGSPTFNIFNDTDATNKIQLTFQSISGDGKTIKLSKAVTESNVNGTYSYDDNGNLIDASVFKDDYGNTLTIPHVGNKIPTELFIDTVKPTKPVLKNSSGGNLTSGRYKDNVTFTVSKDTADTTIKKIEYSKDAGKNWNDYTGSTVLLNSSAALVARVTDYAGNVSEYSDVIDLDIRSSFPDFTVECTKPDGNYKNGTELEFKVSFNSAVNIAANSGAYIQLSGKNTTDKFTGDGKAYLKDKTAKTAVTEAVFTYKTQKQDDFVLKIATSGVVLTDFTDQYGVAQGSRALTAPYERSGLHCDSVAPYVVTMTPAGTKSTQNSLNAFSNAKKIVLEFNENVSVVSGNIYLRQTKGWAIPPMFTADEFNKVLSAAKNASIDTNQTNGLTASKVLYMDGLEDAENLFNSLVGAAHDRYHGTAQYVGPYKKMPNGIKNGSPDLEAKYVLDFGVDIWSSSKSSKDKFGLTFVPNWTKDGNNKTYNSYHHQYYAGWVNRVTPTNTITTDSIRYVLEQAHLHERYMAVNSTYVTVRGNTVTLNFPEDILGNPDLPLGREWELVIEEGAFMDEAGNQFGYEYSGSAVTLSKTSGDTIQLANSGTTKTTSWGRQNSSPANPVVLIQDGNNAAFMSAGVAKPVIRVDRYSYGLGIMQPTSISSGSVVYEMIDSTSTETTSKALGKLQTGSTKPTAKVAVKIDCETKNATIRYAMNTDSKSSSNVSSTANNPPYQNGSNVTTYASSTTVSVPANSTSGDSTGTGSSSEANRVVFLGGNDDYKKSCKQFIYADATLDSLTSVAATEGIFQTVVDINHPLHNKSKSPNDDIYKFGAGAQVVNIHGYTTEAITPYPLRDQLVASAYMRQTYQDGADYYWVSYETLVDANFSMYVYGQNAYNGFDNYGTGNSLNWGDWAKDYGKFVAGEFTLCKELESYVSTWYGDGTKASKRKD